MVKLKALVVDDDKVFCGSLESFLKIGFDCDVTLCFSGANAVSLFEKKKFDLLFLDLVMPGISGVTVLERAIKTNPAIMSFVISGISDAVISTKVEDMGAWYLSKPIELKALEHMINLSLKKHNLIL